MSSILNFLLGLAVTFISVMAAIYAFNKWTVGGVAQLGREPVSTTLGGK